MGEAYPLQWPAGRKRMQKCHPDRGGDADEAARVNEAFRRLVK